MTIKVKTNNKTGYMDASKGDGIVIDQPRARGTVRPSKCPTINTGGGCGVVTEKSDIRVLTPLECWRLMGLCPMNEDGTFNDTNFKKASEVVSVSQLYHQAGNSIVVDVLVHLYLSFLKPQSQIIQTAIDRW